MLPIDKQLEALSVRRDFVVDKDALDFKEVLEELAQAPQLLDVDAVRRIAEHTVGLASLVVATIVAYRSYPRGRRLKRV
jgi:hypothetical protein